MEPYLEFYDFSEKKNNKHFQRKKTIKFLI